MYDIPDALMESHGFLITQNGLGEVAKMSVCNCINWFSQPAVYCIRPEPRFWCQKYFKHGTPDPLMNCHGLIHQTWVYPNLLLQSTYRCLWLYEVAYILDVVTWIPLIKSPMDSGDKRTKSPDFFVQGVSRQDGLSEGKMRWGCIASELTSWCINCVHTASAAKVVAPHSWQHRMQTAVEQFTMGWWIKIQGADVIGAGLSYLESYSGRH